MNEPPPQGRHEGNPETAIVTSGELWCFIERLQLPVRLAGLKMMSRMPSKFEQRPAGPTMLGLPGMSCGLTLANVSVQSVVPDVVDVLQQKNCKGGLHKKCNCGYWPKAQEDATKQHQLQHRTTGDRVRQRRMAPLGLQLQALRNCPGTVRATNHQTDSPLRAEAGSATVATCLWWVRLCSVVKWRYITESRFSLAIHHGSECFRR